MKTMGNGSKMSVLTDGYIGDVGKAEVYNGSTTFAQSNDIVAKTAYNGTVSGNVTIGSDGDGSHMSFVGAGSGVVSGGSAGLSCLVPYTVILRIKTGSVISGSQRLFTHIVSATNLIVVGVFGSAIRAGQYTGSYTNVRSEPCLPNTLYEIVFRGDGAGGGNLEINGVVATGGSAPNTFTSPVGYNIGGNTSNFYTGFLYYLRCYTSSLTDSQRTAELALGQKQTARKDCVLEILPEYFALPAAPTTVYDSVGNSNGTATGGMTVANNSFVLDGVDDKIDVTLPSTSPLNFSFSLRFNTNVLGVDKSLFSTLLGTIASFRDGISCDIRADNKVNFSLRDQTEAYSVMKTSQTITSNTWYNVVGTFDGTTMKIFLNAVLGGSAIKTLGTISNISVARIGFLTGSVSPPTSWYRNGSITGVSLYNRAITDSEVTQIFNAGRNVRTPVTSGLIAEYRPSPTTIYDVKAFTPATPVVIQATFSKTASGSDNVVFTPYIGLQCLTGNIQSTIDQGGGKNSTYTVTHGPTFDAVITGSFVNGSYITKIFVDGVLRDSDTRGTGALTKFIDYISLGRNPSNLYLTGSISNSKIYVGTITDTEGVAMSSGIPVNPVNATLFCEPRRLPPYGTAMTDVSGNGYDFTLTP